MINLVENYNSSQTTNFYVRKADLRNTFISSIDGLNILRGQNLEILRDSSGLYDFNIQSDFFPDSNDQIWFCTFNGFYSYNLISRILNPFRVTDHNGDTLTSDYRVVDFYEDNLFLHVGEEVIRFDILTEKIIGRWCLGPCLECAFEILKQDDEVWLYAGNSVGLEAMRLNNRDEIEDWTRLISKPVSDVIDIDDVIWVARRDSVIYKVIDRHTISEKRLTGSPRSLSRHNDQLIINYGDRITFYNTKTEKESSPLVFSHECAQLSNILDVEIDQDSILWVSSDGDGVFTANLKTPFADFVHEGPDATPPNTTMISASASGDEMILFSRNRGAMVLTRTGDLLREYRTDQHNEVIYTRRATRVGNNFLYYDAEIETLKLFQYRTGVTRILKYVAIKSSSPSFYQLKTLRSGTVLGSTSAEGVGIVSIDEVRNQYSFKAFALPRDTSKVYTYFHEANDGRLYISYNEETIHVYAPDSQGSYQYDSAIPIKNGAWGFYQYPQDSIIYIGNSHGLYRVNANTQQFSELRDDRYLPTTIYCIIGDTLQNLWMSTNSGILGYHIPSNKAQIFVEKDGVSSREFNGHSCYRDESGNMYFGGTEGVTVFNPYRVGLSTMKAPIDVYTLKINDELMDRYHNPDTIRSLRLPYHENTLSFEFQSIDYADPEATRVKYRMSDYDDDWIEAPTSRGFARYANMRPGDYTFSLVGANADGVYSDEVRNISITVKPPFYMTWWFRLSVSAFIIGMSYWIIRSYYRRKLERKDLLLKQQSLLIEKQRAVEHERNRIAAEMHDDLGSGLTRIKYLSERALRMAEDQKESEQIKRISEQSNKLVTNMSEIIWAMNSRFDTAESLSGYIRRYASEYLEENHLPLTFHADTDDNTPVTAEKRRNVFLVVKEVLHNTVKYSRATSVDISMRLEKAHLDVTITEKQATGFDPEAMKEKGNGLFNMQKRMQTIGGKIDFQRERENMIIRLSVPLDGKAS